MMENVLIEAGALQQFKHNDGSDGFVFAYEKAIVDREFARLAAQLADSTAPGAPDIGALTERSNAWDAVCEVLNEVMPTWRNAVGPTTGIKQAVAAIRFLAAPTAQQSLTAGGAVPERRRIAAGLTGLANHVRAVPQYSKLLGDMEIVDQAIAAIAAAPLPQVQSEALDANDICQLPPTDWYCTRKAGHAGPCAAHQHEPDRELGSDDDAAIAKGMARIRADQQPVTPSGALADNDGGVKL